MAGYNRIIMIGNLTRDPEYKQLPSGQPTVRLGLAANRQYRNKQTGSMVQEVCFVDIDVYGPQAESCRQYLQKGRAVLVEGRLKFDTWETAEGQTRSRHSIVADRVVFLSQAQAEGDMQGADQPVAPSVAPAARASSAQSAPAPAVQTASVAPQPVAAQLATTAAPQAASAPASGELAFKDEPPFQDDLPF